MRPYYNCSIIVGAFGFVGPPVAYFLANFGTAMFASAVVFCIWFAMLVWNWHDDGATALLILLPSLLLILLWPAAYAVLVITCAHSAQC